MSHVTLSHEWSKIGEYVEAIADHEEIPVKQLAELSGVHESTISRFFNNIKPVKDKQVFKLGMAIGYAMAERDTKKAQSSFPRA